MRVESGVEISPRAGRVIPAIKETNSEEMPLTTKVCHGCRVAPAVSTLVKYLIRLLRKDMCKVMSSLALVPRIACESRPGSLDTEQISIS